MEEYDIQEHEADEVHERLRAALEIEETACLWTPADAITFTPRLLPVWYGDGRALFTLSTMNQRPAYWIIRGCSTWECGFDSESGDGPDFAQLSDDLLTALEEHFGNGRCGYSGTSLFWPRSERIDCCQCEDCDDEKYIAAWPMVDGADGCSWSRIDWPKAFDTVPNPLSWRGNLLALSV